MHEEQVQKVKEILTEWNPLGERVEEISDLDQYHIEAEDIIFHATHKDHFKNTKVSEKRTQLVVKDVLNQAFSLWLTDQDCEKPSQAIFHVLS